ncbi:MAG: HipA domain-containing protein [Deltaproteobacteria bacterium]|jgi:serine/threonine-protein kinase HipA|nr:HipA domain-containing protein [Deltaproteobacteria bacterium]
MDVTDMAIGQLSLPPRKRKNLIAATNSNVTLAGAQNKLPGVLEGNRLLVPANGSISSTTHVIKAPSAVLPDLQYNEAFCMDLARAAGLPVQKTEIMEIGGTDVLAVERYDRHVRDGSVRRLHQEDFCQALGLYSQQKYEQRQGPGFSACQGVVGRCSDAVGDTGNFTKSPVLNLVVGKGGTPTARTSRFFTNSHRNSANMEKDSAWHLSTTSYPRCRIPKAALIRQWPCGTGSLSIRIG